MQETGVWALGWEDLLEKEMETQYSILTWETHMDRGPGILQSMELSQTRLSVHVCVCAHAHTHTHTHTQFFKTCFKIIIPLPLQLNSSPLPRNNHIWIPPADFYGTFSISPSNIHTLCLFDFSILSIIYWLPPVTSTEMIFFHTPSPPPSSYPVLILMLPIQLYRSLV